MKGVSLSMNVVILLALIVIVLVALFLFFASGFTAPKDDIVLKSQQTQRCAEHANIDRQCERVPDAGLADICNRLGYSSCSSATVQCVKDCCSSACVGTGS